ncbi:Acyl-CoA thioesterase 8 [Boothiomyces macroporosus]|uniref:Acyl-CoA thioesterase 8 n=1 Tax=Boothiomyces macroporosus TaxID=261099 RepID=A0AAD5UIG0_9FUNG|nr:Acyl-CoA thioesterase 8 [Boothiomyces macroporosus]KAJ3312121.1 Acyl-CoA thioesterase 8 [Boothiomyces sp. JEL0838]
MSGTVIEKTLDLEKLDLNLYRSKTLFKPVGARGVFGGQTIALALNAATKTIDPKFHVHSLHCYFILAGDNAIPIVFRVYNERTGKSYAIRTVTATQNGKRIFSMMVSFTVPEESQLNFQVPMPNVPPPDSFKSTEEIMRGLLEDPKKQKYHETIRLRLQQYELLNAALVPFGLDKPTEQRKMTITMMASLDHAIWFHRPFKADEWLLFELESTRSNSGRGFTNGRIYDTSGNLVFSTAQEGVIRAKLTDEQVKLLPFKTKL